MIRQAAALILSLASAVVAQPDPEHAAPAITTEQVPARPASPEGLTKNMIYLEFVTVVGSFKDWFEGEVTVLTDGRSKYCVYGFPQGRYATDEAVPKAILVPGRILEMLGNRRAYRWFSDGTVTPKMIADYNTKSGHLDYPLGD
jgi:hypothetical protein